MEEQLNRIKAQDIVGTLKVIDDSTDLVARTQQNLDFGSLNAYLEVKEYAKKLENRERWNTNLLWMVAIGFVFSISVIVLIGTGVLHFQNSQITVPVAISSGFLETYALAKIALNYLFDGNKK